MMQHSCVLVDVSLLCVCIGVLPLTFGGGQVQAVHVGAKGLVFASGYTQVWGLGFGVWGLGFGVWGFQFEY